VPSERLPEPVEAAAYYLIAEALTNVAKYAQASTVDVAIAATDGKHRGDSHAPTQEGDVLRDDSPLTSPRVRCANTTSQWPVVARFR
jgi:hypothetical protein